MIDFSCVANLSYRIRRREERKSKPDDFSVKIESRTLGLDKCQAKAVNTAED